MTDETVPIGKALEEHDLTIAFTPGQLLLIVAGVFVLIRIIRGLRG